MRRPPWILVLALVAASVALYWKIGVDLVADWWNDPNYSHGFLVPVFSGYLLWQERDRLRNLPIGSHPAGLVLLLLGLGMFVLGAIGAEEFLQRASLVVVLAGLVLFHLGAVVFRNLLFPLGFLVFMVPLPSILFNAITFPLQGLAAENATVTLEVLGVPVMRDGHVIHLSHITLGVTEACSGIRSLISLLALAVVWAYLAVPGLWLQILFVVSAVPITILANAGRVVLTALIAQYIGLEYAQGFFHDFSGWIIFLVAFVGLLGVHAVLVAGRKLFARESRS